MSFTLKQALISTAQQVSCPDDDKQAYAITHDGFEYRIWMEEGQLMALICGGYAKPEPGWPMLKTVGIIKTIILDMSEF